MYLRSLEIAGFKSFAKRSQLELSNGVVGIVGPNGAGKSNLADAIRWVLGEQSVKLMRTKKSEEVIFAGTQSRPRASMAEVSILLDNSDNAMPIEFSEVQITRRLYRSGESEYLLNGRRARLLDVAEILAQSGFGQQSYSVIGQGMIDSILLATPAARKTMFDEASGIKTYDLRREVTRKKMAATLENINKIELNINQLRPLHEQLGGKIATARRHSILQTQMSEYQQAFIDFELTKLQKQRQQLSSQLEQKQIELATCQTKLADLHQRQSDISKTQAQAQKNLAQIQKDLILAETERDQDYDRLATATAELKLQQAASQAAEELNKSVAQVENLILRQMTKLDKIKASHKQIEKQNRAYEQEISAYNDRLDIFNRELTDFRNRLAKNQKSDFILHALGLVKMLKLELRKPDLSRPDLAVLLHKLGRIIKIASEDNAADLLSSINKQQKIITREMSKREDIIELQTNDIIKMRSLELDMAYLEKELIEARKHKSELETKQSGADTKELSKTANLVDKITGKIEQADEHIASLRASLVAPAESKETLELTQIASQIERNSAQQATLRVEFDQLNSELQRLDKTQAEVVEQAQNWGLAASGQASDKPIDLAEIHRLEGELATLSDVDQSTREQYEQISTKLEYLQTQHQDLTTSIADMEKINQNLDRLIMETFVTAFAKINHQFGHFFKQLFGGGTAELKLEKGEDGSYGVEIVVNPPGKRIELLVSLSGGERAMASLALLAAILSVNPSPFVVLDEVDAALDDANSAKFNKIIKELSRRSQLIIITHNHQTMQQATELVGVAPHKGADSKLIHVKLAQARQLTEV